MNRRLALLTLPLLSTGCASFLFSSTRSEFTPPEPTLMVERLEAMDDAPNGTVDHYAVLLGANTELRHRGNLSMAYQVLLEQGYDRDDVFVLDSEGTTPFFPLTDVTSRAAVELLFERLAKIVETHDTLLIYMTGHGNRVTAEESDNGQERVIGVSTLMLNPAEEMTQSEIQMMLERIHPEVGIVFFDQCYWGALSSQRMCNYVTISTATDKETSAGVSFPRAFWRAFRDGHGEVVTVLDAFRYAMVKDPATRMGFHRPSISHGCVNPSALTILGKHKTAVQAPPGETPVATREMDDE